MSPAWDSDLSTDLCTAYVTLGVEAPGAFTRRRCGGTSRARVISTSADVPAGRRRVRALAPTPSVS